MDRTAHDTTVETWVAAFGAALDRHDIDGVLDLFEPDGFWRDLAALTWNVYTAEGGDAIRTMLILKYFRVDGSQRRPVGGRKPIW